MSAHPQLSRQEVNEMVKYILKLSSAKVVKGSIGNKGSLPLNDHKPDESRGTYTLTASYTDAGANGIAPLTGTSVISLQPAKVKAVYTDVSRVCSFGNSLGGGDQKHSSSKDKDMTAKEAQSNTRRKIRMGRLTPIGFAGWAVILRTPYKSTAPGIPLPWSRREIWCH